MERVVERNQVDLEAIATNENRNIIFQSADLTRRINKIRPLSLSREIGNSIVISSEVYLEIPDVAFSNIVRTYEALIALNVVLSRKRIVFESPIQAAKFSLDAFLEAIKVVLSPHGR